MSRKYIKFLAAAAAIAAPFAASAQTATFDGPYVGIQGGYHDLDGFDGAIFGGHVGYNGAAGNLIIGAEGNFNFGTDDIDNEYGVSAHVGTPVGDNAALFLRGGYQWVEVDFGPFEIEDDDYLVGVGAGFAGGPGAFRIFLDTIAFDSVRATLGYSWHF